MLYITAWDFNGIGSAFRDLDAMPGEWTDGSGKPGDPKIQDAITLQLK